MESSSDPKQQHTTPPKNETPSSDEAAGCQEPETSYNVFHKEPAVFTPMSVAGTERTAMLSQSFDTLGLAGSGGSRTIMPTPGDTGKGTPSGEDLNSVHRKWEDLAQTWKATVAAVAPKSPENPKAITPENGRSINNTQTTGTSSGGQQLLALSPLSKRSSSPSSPLVSPSNNRSICDATPVTSRSDRKNSTSQILFHSSNHVDSNPNTKNFATTAASTTSTERPFRPYGFDYTPVSGVTDTTTPTSSASRGARTSRLKAYTSMSVFERLYGQANVPPPASPMLQTNATTKSTNKSSSTVSPAKGTPKTTANKTTSTLKVTPKQIYQAKKETSTNITPNSTNSKTSMSKSKTERQSKVPAPKASKIISKTSPKVSLPKPSITPSSNSNSNTVAATAQKKPWKVSSTHPRSFRLPTPESGTKSKPLLSPGESTPTISTSSAMKNTKPSSTPSAQRQSKVATKKTASTARARSTSPIRIIASPPWKSSSKYPQSFRIPPPAAGKNSRALVAHATPSNTTKANTKMAQQSATPRARSTSPARSIHRKTNTVTPQPWKTSSRYPRSFRIPAPVDGAKSKPLVSSAPPESRNTANQRPATTVKVSKTRSKSPVRSQSKKKPLKASPPEATATAGAVSSSNNKPKPSPGSPLRGRSRQNGKHHQHKRSQQPDTQAWKSPSRTPKPSNKATTRGSPQSEGPLTMIQLRMLRTQRLKEGVSSTGQQRALSSSPLRRRMGANNSQARLQQQDQRRQQQSHMPYRWCTPPRQRQQDSTPRGVSNRPASISLDLPSLKTGSLPNNSSKKTADFLYSPSTAAGAKGVVQSAYRDAHHSVEQRHEMVHLFRQERNRVGQQQQQRQRQQGSVSPRTAAAMSLRAKWHATQPMHQRHEAAKRIQHWYRHRFQSVVEAKAIRAARCIQVRWRYHRKRSQKREEDRKAAELLQLCWWRKLSGPETKRIEKATTSCSKHEHVPKQVQEYVTNAREKKAMEAQATKLLQLCWWRDLSTEEQRRVSKIPLGHSDKNDKFDRIPQDVREFVVSSREIASTQSRAARILQQWWSRRRVRVQLSLHGNDYKAASPTPVQRVKQWHKASPQMQQVVRGAQVRKLERIRQNAAAAKLQGWSRMVSCQRAYEMQKRRKQEGKLHAVAPQPKLRLETKEISTDGGSTTKTVLKKISSWFPKAADAATTATEKGRIRKPLHHHIDLSVGKKKEYLEKQKWNLLKPATEPASSVVDPALRGPREPNGAKGASIDMQSIYRQAFSRRKRELLEERNARKEAAKQIQKWWKSSELVKHFISRRRIATTKIQSVYRGFLFHMVYHHLRFSAMQIQCCWRRYKRRLDATRAEINSYSAVKETRPEVERSVSRAAATLSQTKTPTMSMTSQSRVWSLFLYVMHTLVSFAVVLFLALCWVDGIVSVKHDRR